MVTVTVYVDLSDAEESKLADLKLSCQEIITNINTIDSKDNIGSELVVKLTTIAADVETINSLLSEINNISSTITSSM